MLKLHPLLTYVGLLVSPRKWLVVLKQESPVLTYLLPYQHLSRKKQQKIIIIEQKVNLTTSFYKGYM